MLIYVDDISVECDQPRWKIVMRFEYEDVETLITLMLISK